MHELEDSRLEYVRTDYNVICFAFACLSHSPYPYTSARAPRMMPPTPTSDPPTDAPALTLCVAAVPDVVPDAARVVLILPDKTVTEPPVVTAAVDPPSDDPAPSLDAATPVTLGTSVALPAAVPAATLVLVGVGVAVVDLPSGPHPGR